MCQMSMNLSVMFDQNCPQTLDKILAKHIAMKNDLNLDPEPKCQGHSKNWSQGTKSMPPLKQRSRDSPSNWCQLMCKICYE